MLHSHDFNHEKIGLCGFFVDGENGIGNVRCELFGNSGIKLCREGCSRNGKEQFTVDLAVEFKCIKEL
jgi:hypothetical protein